MTDGAANCSEAHSGVKNSGRGGGKERAGLSPTARVGAGHVPGLQPTSPLGETDAASAPQPGTPDPSHRVPKHCGSPGIAPETLRG